MIFQSLKCNKILQICNTIQHVNLVKHPDHKRDTFFHSDIFLKLCAGTKDSFSNSFFSHTIKTEKWTVQRNGIIYLL